MFLNNKNRIAERQEPSTTPDGTVKQDVLMKGHDTKIFKGSVFEPQNPPEYDLAARGQTTAGRRSKTFITIVEPENTENYNTCAGHVVWPKPMRPRTTRARNVTESLGIPRPIGCTHACTRDEICGNDPHAPRDQTGSAPLTYSQLGKLSGGRSRPESLNLAGALGVRTAAAKTAIPHTVYNTEVFSRNI